MFDFLQILVPLFMSVENYNKMRQKMASFVFYEVFIASFFIRRMNEYSTAFRAVESQIFGVDLLEKYPVVAFINPLGLVIAFLAATFTYMFHLHDRISDVLGIRKSFDQEHILKVLVSETNVTLKPGAWARIDANHDRTMSNVYYKYVSSTAKEPLVDRHDISQALDSWAWFWVALEGVVIWVVLTVISIVAGSDRGIIWFSILAILYLAIMFGFRPLLRRRARAQVEKIADNHTAKTDVEVYLREI